MRSPFGIGRWKAVIVVAGLYCAIGTAGVPSTPSGIADARLARNGNVVLIYRDGSRISLTRKGNNDSLQISDDRLTVAWRKTTETGSSVFLYRNGSIRKIEGGPFIRGFWFVDGGKKIGVDSGGLHFAGVEILYDVATLKELDSMEQATVPGPERPEWSWSAE